jgi:hypothetical protein
MLAANVVLPRLEEARGVPPSSSAPARRQRFHGPTFGAERSPHCGFRTTGGQSACSAKGDEATQRHCFRSSSTNFQPLASTQPQARAVRGSILMYVSTQTQKRREARSLHRAAFRLDEAWI